MTPQGSLHFIVAEPEGAINGTLDESAPTLIDCSLAVKKINMHVDIIAAWS